MSLLLWTHHTQAEPILAAGLLGSATTHVGAPPMYGGFGGEVSLVKYFSSKMDGLGVGGVAQVQSVGLDHVRAQIGPQVNYWTFGSEFCLFAEQKNATYATTLGLHLAPFMSIGFASAAFRIGIPLTTVGSGPRYPVDLGAVLTLKVVIDVSGGRILFFSTK